MFYDILKNECEKQGLKITPLVLECGGSKGNLSHWRSGASPKSDIVAKLARRLNVSTDYLLGVAPEQSNSVSTNSGTIGVIGNANAPVTIKNGHARELTKQEQDLLRIYNSVNGKTQMKIMNFLYEIEDGAEDRKI